MGEQCETCGRSNKHLRKIWKPDDFKKEFQVGDRVSGWATDKVVTITAIGRDRFLYLDSGRHKESVGKMSAQCGWRKIK